MRRKKKERRGWRKKKKREAAPLHPFLASSLRPAYRAALVFTSKKSSSSSSCFCYSTSIVQVYV
jgi:hypothetical protein